MVERHQELLEEVRSETSFQDCQDIKEAGVLYRESGSIADAASSLEVSEAEAEERVKQYISIVNDPTKNVELLEIIRGVRFYGGQESFEELIQEYDASEEEIQDGLRDFIGVSLHENDFEEVEVSVEQISNDPVYPPSVIKNAQKVQETVSKAVDSIPVKILADLSTMSARISRTIRESLQPMMDSLIPMVREFRSQVAEAIRDGISNFDSPQEYDPEAVEVNELARGTAVTSLERLIEQIEDEEGDAFSPYLPRLKAVLEDFEQSRYYTPIFVSISVQDGLMDWLCEQSSKNPEGTNRFGEAHYKWTTKRNILAGSYEGWYSVESDDVIPNLEAFYQHRNAIMHGDPLAYFDENIAIISMLFLNLTLYTVIDSLEEESSA